LLLLLLPLLLLVVAVPSAGELLLSQLYIQSQYQQGHLPDRLQYQPCLFLMVLRLIGQS
jgi:hypothetical protein